MSLKSALDCCVVIAVADVLHDWPTLCGHYLFTVTVYADWLAARSDLGGIRIEPVQN